jgi:hypothetical protein
VVKRDDGDHVTIWVHNSFEEGEPVEELPAGLDSSADELADDDAPDTKLAKRQKTAIKNEWDGVLRGHECWWDKTIYHDDTGPTAPYTGGLNAVVSWGRNRKGGWWVRSTRGRDLIVAVPTAAPICASMLARRAILHRTLLLISALRMSALSWRELATATSATPVEV